MEIGQIVTYYPNRNNYHFHIQATIIAFTPKRVRIVTAGSEKPILCAPNKVLEQAEFEY